MDVTSLDDPQSDALAFASGEFVSQGPGFGLSEVVRRKILDGTDINGAAPDGTVDVNFGAGFRFLLNDSIALHIDFRDHLFDIDILGEEKTAHNLEGTLGITVFF